MTSEPPNQCMYPLPTSPLLGLQTRVPIPAFLGGFWSSNPNPLAYEAGTGEKSSHLPSLHLMKGLLFFKHETMLHGVRILPCGKTFGILECHELYTFKLGAHTSCGMERSCLPTQVGSGKIVPRNLCSFELKRSIAWLDPGPLITNPNLSKHIITWKLLE